MEIYTIHSNSNDDEALIGLSYGFFTDENEAIKLVEELTARAEDPDDDDYVEGTEFWYNAYHPHSTADDIGFAPTAG